jgi:hypothetical protein
VAVLIDPWNYVNEGPAGEANNRGEEQNAQPAPNQPWVINFTVTNPTPEIPPLNELYLPLVAR